MSLANAAELETSFFKGDYETVLAQGEVSSPDEAELTIRSALALGRYEEAAKIGRKMVARHSGSAVVLLTAADAAAAVGDNEISQACLRTAALINPAGALPEDAAALAEVWQRLGADPRAVLEQVLDPIRAAQPKAVEPWLATARLALNKNDGALAEKNLVEAAKLAPANPEIPTLRAQVFANTHPKETLKYVEQALALNPRMAEALLVLAILQIRESNYDEARKTIDRILAVNARHPPAVALLSAMATLREDEGAAQASRDAALTVNPRDPEVDLLIGMTLAWHYRFEEAIAALESALAMDPNDLPVRFELGQNLLRFGRDAEGWKLIAAVHAADPYHVGAYNLMTLHDQMANYRTLSRDRLRVRMARLDATVFGQSALRLATEAQAHFSDRYGFKPDRPVTVEIFPEEQDFAVRTFGSPGCGGFLGVCFGPLVTMSSPRGRLGRADWEAVLWHEMAHVITLGATQHRIPRWLSEGISVYEERLARPNWGKRMNARFRNLIEEDKLTPIPKLNEAFSEDVDFAYFQASLVVEFIVDKYGIDTLRALLGDLRKGRTIGEALAARTAPPETLQKEFHQFASARAAEYGPGIDWKPLTDEEFAALQRDPDAWLKGQPNRYDAVLYRARKLAEGGKHRRALDLLRPLIALEPFNRETPNPRVLAAASCRALGDLKSEQEMLETYTRVESDTAEAWERLLEIARAQDNPGLAEQAADGLLALNPFQQDALRTTAQSSARAGKRDAAIESYEALLATGPIDTGRVHFELAGLQKNSAPAQAKRHLLEALEIQPRFREALEALTDLSKSSR